MFILIFLNLLIIYKGAIMKIKEDLEILCHNLEKKNYVKGIVLQQENFTIFIDVFLNGNAKNFSCCNGWLTYSSFYETYRIWFYYHNLNTISKIYVPDFSILERLLNGKIYYDETKKLIYYQKFLQSQFDNPIQALLKKKKSQKDF